MKGPACRGRDADRWFSRSRADQEYAINHCNACPVRDRCLAETLRIEGLGTVSYTHLYGVAGGLTVSQRLEVITPLCPDCEAPRPAKKWRCGPCAEKARREAHKRELQAARLARASGVAA